MRSGRHSLDSPCGLEAAGHLIQSVTPPKSMVDSWLAPVLGTNFLAAKLLSLIAYCFQAAISVGCRTSWIWLGTIAFAILGWLLMQTWLRAWNLQWNGTLPSGLCLVCALTFAVAAFAIFGAINLETFLVGKVEQTGENLRKSSEWGIDTFQKSLSDLGLPVTGSKRAELQNADQLNALHQSTEAKVRQAFASQLPGLLTGKTSVSIAEYSELDTSQGFSVRLDSYVHWAEQAIDHQVQAGVQQVRTFAERVTGLVIRAVAGACLLFNGLVAVGAACCAYRAIFQSSYKTMALPRVL